MTKIVYVWVLAYSIFFNSIAMAAESQSDLIASSSKNDIQMITNGTSVAKSIVYGDGHCNRACRRTAKKFSKAFVRSIKERGIDEVDTDEEFGFLSTELLNMALASIDRALKESGSSDEMKNFFENPEFVNSLLKNLLAGLQKRGYNKFVKVIVGGVLVVGLVATGLYIGLAIAYTIPVAPVAMGVMAGGGLVGGKVGVKVNRAIYDSSLPNHQIEILTEGGESLLVDYQESEIEDNNLY
ncbi:MAG: hypothetical protein CME63_16420 [Halobacteriovoraceae bacterium]|nr:hypothetical protein [Halobacteriovoraceae bacterium]|tara:strand:+ start:26847 stop:27566 length:720 start_codon:yes stop_codon:yes gene_type:complete